MFLPQKGKFFRLGRMWRRDRLAGVTPDQPPILPLMPLTQLSTYLRTYRKRAGLTQDEMAFLLGCATGAKVSRYECNERRPRLERVFAYEILFRAPARSLFPGVFHEVRMNTLTRAAALARRLTKQPSSPSTLRKLKVLRDLTSESAIRT
ncbi:MAG: XRE family transcriptional regulator [Desulfobacteraceae bacterium]|nr:MAG: XRE family transcriptional regulator [Desulfobacteraceae bacterium]